MTVGILRHRVHGTTVMEGPDPATLIVWPAGSQGPEQAMVRGPLTRARYYSERRHAGCRTLRLDPGTAATLLGRPVKELTDRTIPLPTLLPRPAPTAESSGKAVLLREAQTLLHGGTTVRHTAQRLHVSERHLRDLFTETIGMSPLRYLALHRVRLVLDRPALPLPEAAALAGYYDQSHMTAEFKRIIGTPPGAFRAGRWPTGRSCGSA